MHPWIPLAVGAVVGALGYVLACGGLKARYERIAFAAGGVAVILAGVGVIVAGLPVIDTSATAVKDLAVKRLLGMAGGGLSLFLMAANGAVVFQSGSGGFSSTRSSAMMATVVFAVVLAISLGGALAKAA